MSAPTLTQPPIKASWRRVAVRRRVTADPTEWPTVQTIGGPWTARTKREAQALAIGYTAGLASAQADIEAARRAGREDFAAEIMPALRWAWGASPGAPTPEAQRAAWREVQALPWREIRDRHLHALAAVDARRRWDTTTNAPRAGDQNFGEAA